MPKIKKAKPKIKKIISKSKKAVKKLVKKNIRKSTPVKVAVEGKLIGKITHYFSNIEVAVIDLTATLKEGDNIRIVGGQETDFEQKVSSIQIDHEEVKLAKKGDSAGMKINEKVHEGYKVYKI